MSRAVGSEAHRHLVGIGARVPECPGSQSLNAYDDRCHGSAVAGRHVPARGDGLQDVNYGGRSGGAEGAL